VKQKSDIGVVVRTDSSINSRSSTNSLYKKLQQQNITSSVKLKVKINTHGCTSSMSFSG